MPQTPNIPDTEADDASELQPKGERDKIIEAARDIYSSDDVEIDDDAALSEADTHVWVSAWVRVPFPLDDQEKS